jgi:NADPH:quinone reductase-like Zn-dependent oxidoreductase
LKAIIYHRYGSPDALELQEINKPLPKDDEVLVRIRAASANPRNWHHMRGSPYVARLSFGLHRQGDADRE